jgi:GGDEF domain-containing protein
VDLRNAGGGTDWIVLLEVSGGNRSTIDARRFHGLVASFGPVAPATLFSPDRYALQLAVRAHDAVSALSTAIDRWHRALRRCDLPDWQLVRAEVMTPAELEAELDGVDAEPGGLYAEAWVPAPRREIDAMEEDLLRRALFDSVTGLPSRALFLDEVRRVLESGSAGSAVHAVVAVHVAVPDAAAEHDRPPPDEVLAAVARRLEAMVRTHDVVARYAPFEFALLLKVRSDDDVDRLAGRILDGVRRPLVGLDAPLAAKAGVAVARGGVAADRLLQAAQLAARDAPRRAGRRYRRVV